MRFPALQNAENILTSESRGIVLSFLFCPHAHLASVFYTGAPKRKSPRIAQTWISRLAGIRLAFCKKNMGEISESAFRLSRPLAAYKGMASPSRYRAAGTCVPCSATCTWYASLIGAYRSVSSAVLYPASGKRQKMRIFAASRSCTCSSLFAAYMPGLPARLRDRRLRRFLLGFLPVYIIAQNNINIL